MCLIIPNVELLVSGQCFLLGKSVTQGRVPMGIDRLTKAADAAGYAMANSEDLLLPPAAPRKDEVQGWRVADPVQQSRDRVDDIEPAKPASALRDWWFTLSSKATA